MTMMVHTFTIERATAGDVDDYNSPTQTWATVAVVKGLIQPKSATERAQLNQAGAVVGDYNIFMPLTTDVSEADYVLWLDGIYQVKGIERRDYGRLNHIRADAEKVTE